MNKIIQILALGLVLGINQQMVFVQNEK